MKALGHSRDRKKYSIPHYVPDFVAESIVDVDFGKLQALGVTHIFIDLDQTIRVRYSKALEEEVINFLLGLRETHIFKGIGIISNNRRNLKKFSEPLGARVFQPYRARHKTIRKPNPVFFKKVLSELKLKPGQAVMIGDKIRFDIAGANKVGMYTVLVTPRGPDYWFDRVLFTRLRERRALVEAQKELVTKTPKLSTNEAYIKHALIQIGFIPKRITPHDGDARGSLPFVATDGKRKVFIKLVSRRHNLADWLFKLWRNLFHRQVEDELPFVSTKQALEHEAYIGSLAHKAGVRTPNLEGLIDLGNHKFALVFEYLDAKSLDTLPAKRLKGKVLQDIWRQVSTLHGAHIAHRDLRTANILLDKKSMPWIIDFDFATVAATPQNLGKDNIELLVSLATCVGAKKSVKYACTILKPHDFKSALPLLRKRNLSAATRRELRKKPKMLKDLRSYVEILAASAAAQ